MTMPQTPTAPVDGGGRQQITQTRSTVDHLSRHRGRHIEAFSRHLGVWRDTHDQEYWSQPSVLYWASVAAGGPVTP